MIGHEVVQYPVRMAKQDLTFDGKLPQRWTREGWVLKQNGLKWYRIKMLCRDCITKQVVAEATHAEYKKLCKAAIGEDNATYAQMLASQ